MNAKMNVPELRFKEFSGEWEEEKVGKLCDSIVPGRNKPTSFDGDIPWITTPDIQHNGVIEFSKNGLKITETEAKNIGSKIVPENSIIMSCVGDLGLVAISGQKIVINQQLHAFIPRERANYRFLLYQIGLQKKYMERVATKTAVPYMNKENCNSIPIIFPSMREQEKIASFLSLVDAKIEQLSKKQKLLQEYKKGAMQKIFSQEIRFKDEDASEYPEWVEKKLDEIFNFLRGSSLSKADITECGINKCIHYGELFTTYKEKISNIKFTTNLTEGQFSKVGDILMPSSDVTPQGLATASAIFEDNVILGGDINILRPKKNIDSLFVSYFLNSNKNEIMKVVTGTTVKHIYNKDVAKLKINMPIKIKEQTKIANFLASIDAKIELNSKELDATKEFKKALLQKMFV